METVSVADLDFNLAVKLLVHAHEQAISRLQGPAGNVPSPDMSDVSNACAHTVTPKPHQTVPYLLQPRSIKPTPLMLDVNSLGGSNAPRNINANANEVDSTHADGLNSDSADMMKPDEMDAEAIKRPCLHENGPCPEAVNQWYVMVAKLLGSYRVPLQPRETWSAARTTYNAEGSVARFRSKRTAIYHIENRIKGKRNFIIGRSRSQSVYSVEILNVVQYFLLSCQPQSFMLHPTSSARLFWMFLCLPMLFYEMVLVTMTPFALANMQWAKNVDFFCASFWTIDICVCFRSGFFTKGNKTEMRAAAVARHYLRTWFMFDLGIASLQWLAVYEHLTGTKTAAGSLASLAVVRLLRLGRVSKIINRFNFGDALLANFGRIGRSMIFHMKIAREVAKGFLAALLIVHCNACGWYEMSKGADGWSSEYGSLLKGYISNDYLVCVHWSLAQFQGNVDLYPGSSTKARAFACASSVLCIVFLTSFVGALTGTIVSLRDERKRQLRDVTLMSNFLDRQAMPREVMLRATYYVSSWEIQQADRMAHEDDQKALKLFPKGLRGQLMSAFVEPYLVKIPAFVFLQEYHPNIFAAMCVDSMTQRVCALDDDLFTNREPAKYMYVIVSGQVTYNSTSKPTGVMDYLLDNLVQSATLFEQFADDNTSLGTSITLSRQESPASSGIAEEPIASELSMTGKHTRGTIVKRLGQSDILSEAALWLQCIHEGDLCCSSVCDCLLVCSTSLGEIVSRYEDPLRTCSDYACRFAVVAEEIKKSEDKRSFIDLLGAEDILHYQVQRDTADE